MPNLGAMTLEEAVSQSTSIAGVLRLLGRACVGSNYDLVREAISSGGIDTSHWGRPQGGQPQVRPTFEMACVENSPFSTQAVKTILLREGRLEYRCAICSLGATWEGKSLTLRLDHINGHRRDSRIENLRYLCPNCDSQTSTFCGRNKKRAIALTRTCRCGKLSTVGRCQTCANEDRGERPTKIEWPPTDLLKKELEATSFLAVARRLGVSDNAIRKRIRSRSLAAKQGLLTP